MPDILIKQEQRQAWARRLVKDSNEQCLAKAEKEFQAASKLFAEGVLNSCGRDTFNKRLAFYSHYQSGALALDKLTTRLSNKNMIRLFKDAAEGFDAQKSMSSMVQEIVSQDLYPYYKSTLNTLLSYLQTLENSNAVHDFVNGMKAAVEYGTIEQFEQEWARRFAIKDDIDQAPGSAPEDFTQVRPEGDMAVLPPQDDVPEIQVNRDLTSG